jgi:hypothetical protein
VNEAGLSMVIDPRWIVAVPENDDVHGEVARQLGPAPRDVDPVEWDSLGGAVTSMLRSALDGGALWTGVWFTVDQAGTLVLSRATLSTSASVTADGGPLSVEQLFDETVVLHRDDDYRAEIGMVSMSLGTAISHRQVVVVDDGGRDEVRLGDHAGLTWVTADGIVEMRAFCTQVGWAGVWYPQLEAMAQTLRADAETKPGAVTMLAYVVDDGGVLR